VILLDTHAWIWWVSDPARLSRRARAVMGRSAALGVSVMSCWEAALLAARGRLDVSSDSPDSQAKALVVEKVELLPMTPAIAERAAQHQAARGGDPIDWMLVATALELGVRIVSKDDRIRSCGLADVVW
jgi:PIN domain nuclease of toxin-antitoxin system